YYPFTQLIRYARGVSLDTLVECERYHVDGYVIDDMNQYGDFDDVNYVQAAAALNEEDGELAVFVINADWEDAQAFTLDARGFEGWRFAEHLTMATADENARNTYENPNAILPKADPDTRCEKGIVTATLPKLSWNLFRFTR
ncbi:MAG TPA: alpha-L-arabinofuranosidase C-terminal domain-containing protein, partial [Candidatus Limiplasma sp.]|nr:alpha-L-arabinofuranosidase C-terminal domain-containing protein [Candidatus Limiplasma sp.]